MNVSVRRAKQYHFLPCALPALALVIASGRPASSQATTPPVAPAAPTAEITAGPNPPIVTPAPVMPLPGSQGVSPPAPLLDVEAITKPSAEANATPRPVETVKPVNTPAAAAPPAPAPAEMPPVMGAEPPRSSYQIESESGWISNYEQGIAMARGGVKLTYREFTVTGQRGVWDFRRNRATLSGDLTVTVRGQKFTGKTLNFDMESGQWTLTQLESVFQPDFFPPGTVLEPIYLRNGTVTGNDDEVRGQDFRFSSCEFEHYFIQSRRIDFYRDARGEPDRIVLRRNTLYVLGQKTLALPVYVISLSGSRSRRYGLQPTFGQDAVDGYFVKSVYDLSANERRTDSLLLDALQKRGIGLGFQRELARGAGLLYLYALSGKKGGREIDAKLHREWRITPGLQALVNFQSTRNSAFGGNTTNQNGDWSLLYTSSQVKSNLLMRYNDSSSDFGGFRQLNLSWLHQQRFSRDLSLDLSSLYASSTFTGLEDTRTFDNAATLTRRGRLFDALLSAELHDDLTGRTQRNGAYQLERLPELSLISDTGRLRVPLLSRYLPGDFSVKIGDFNEPSSLQRLTRADMNYGLRPQRYQVARIGRFRSELNVGGAFEQAFYSDDTARYTYAYNFNLKNTLGRFSTQLNYFKQRTLGFTPFFFDFQPPGETVEATASYEPSQKFRLNLSTGRDLQNGFTRDVIGSLQLKPSRHFYASLAAIYSPETKTFGAITSNIRIARPPNRLLGGNLDMGIRYSADSGQLERVNATADIFVTGKTRVQALTSYNGFSKEFDLNQVRVTRDMHCFNLFVTFDQQRKQLRLDLSLKALPFLDTRFGQSRLGEGFDPFVGQVQ